MSKTPIQWHHVRDNEVPQVVAGDHVYFTESGVYVNDATGTIHKVAGNYENQINVLNAKTSIANEDRETNTLPSDYVSGIKLRGLKKAQALGIDLDAYAHVFGYNTWNDNSAYVYEVAFVNGFVYTRKNIDQNENSEGYNQWGEWDRLATLREIQKIKQQLNAISEIMMETNNLK